MSKSLTEAKVLEKLDIPDFRHLTKDKVVSFVSMLPNMDPEVAKCALGQFPAFAETSLSIVSCMKETMATAVNGNGTNMSEFNALCQGALASLEEQLSNEALTDESREQIINAIVEIVGQAGQKDSENKEYLSRIFTGVLVVTCVTVVCLVSPLGIKAAANLARI